MHGRATANDVARAFERAFRNNGMLWCACAVAVGAGERWLVPMTQTGENTTKNYPEKITSDAETDVRCSRLVSSNRDIRLC